MWPMLVKLLGDRLVHKELKRRTNGFFDVRLGIRLLRSKQVPVRPKLLATGLACALLAALLAAEFPIESLLATLLVGMPIDVAVDGLEIIVAPLLFTALMLPWLAPRVLVEAVRDGRTEVMLDSSAEPQLYTGTNHGETATPAALLRNDGR